MSEPTRRPPAVPRLIQPLQEFLSTETAGGVLLLGATIVALIWANAPFSATYTDLWGVHAGPSLGSVDLHLSLVQWVNDGLMAIFFFVVGLEIKRELLRGELADRRRAALPVAAALGGMALPAAIYLAFNLSRDGEHGWAIPMATDIAFAVGILSLVGQRIPLSLKVFLLALAIVDDLGAIAVIAVFYSDSISFGWLATSVVFFALAFLVARQQARAFVIVYVVLAVGAWLAVRESGVHATIAGVILGLLAPLDPALPGALDASRRRAPLERLEHTLHPWSSYVIVPIFALANAGISLDAGAIRGAATSPVTAGVAAGLVIGKPLGILLFAWLAVRAGIATLPSGVDWPALGRVAMIAGIGFTVSLFVSDLAFGGAALRQDAKIGVLAGSFVMALAGSTAVLLASRTGPQEESAKGP